MPAIKGQIASPLDTPIGAITVELINPTGDIVDQVQVDAEGRFLLHVSSGTWKLNAYGPQGQRGEASVEIDSDDVSTKVTLG
jgi:Protein of unknown function (DUF1416)